MLRTTKALPGKALVIYDPAVEVATEVFLCEDGKAHKCRRICIKLKEPTRDWEMEINILTNLPKAIANGKFIAEAYRKRWKIETMFQELEAHLNSEINTLGYPKAALFGFCVAIVAYNVLAVLKFLADFMS